VFFFTRKDVRSLNIEVNTGDGQSRWIRLMTQSIDATEAASAHLPYRVHFALGTPATRLTCVERVVALDRDGKRIEMQRVPCSTL
jgi:hypothetical protein